MPSISLAIPLTPQARAVTRKAITSDNIFPPRSKEDVTRYPFASPVVCASDYDNHPQFDAFRPTQAETRGEALKQLETIEAFHVHYLRDRKGNVGLWDGCKDFSIPGPEQLPRAPA